MAMPRRQSTKPDERNAPRVPSARDKSAVPTANPPKRGPYAVGANNAQYIPAPPDPMEAKLSNRTFDGPPLRQTVTTPGQRLGGNNRPSRGPMTAKVGRGQTLDSQTLKAGRSVGGSGQRLTGGAKNTASSGPARTGLGKQRG